MDSCIRKPKGSRTIKDNRRCLMSSNQRLKQQASNSHLEDSAIGPLHKRGGRDIEESKDRDDPLTSEREYKGIGKISGDTTNERLYFNRKSGHYFEEN
jgi:hypothetical protein